MASLLDRLKRTTNQGGFIPEIDGLRFFAIITVLIFHLNTTYTRVLGLESHGLKLYHIGDFDLGWYFRRLDMGVKVFFAISGFILSLPFLRYYLLGAQEVRVGDYFMRRLKRLEPPFLLSLLLIFIGQVFFMNLQLETPGMHMLATILYSHVIAYGVSSPINPVTWSLETEAQFYTIVPFLFWLLFRHKKTFIRIGLLVVLFYISIYFRQFSTIRQLHHIEHTVLSYLSNFLVGTAFAWLYLMKKEFFSRKSILWDIVGMFSLWLMFKYYKPQYYISSLTLFNISIFLFFLSVFKGKLFNLFFTWGPIYIIGGMCYSIYLLHYSMLYVILNFTAPLTKNLPYFQGLCIQFLLVVPLLLLLISVFYWLIEKPCMDKHWPAKTMAWIRSKMSAAPQH